MDYFQVVVIVVLLDWFGQAFFWRIIIMNLFDFYWREFILWLKFQQKNQNNSILIRSFLFVEFNNKTILSQVQTNNKFSIQLKTISEFFRVNIFSCYKSCNCDEQIKC